MKYAILMPSGYIGGSEICTYETIMALKKNGVNTCVFFPNFFIPFKGGIIDKIGKYSSANHIIFYEWWAILGKLSLLRKLKFIYRCIESSFKIARICKQNNAEIIISNTVTVPQAAIAALISGKKHVWYLHELGEEDHGLLFIFGTRFSCFLINKLSNMVILNSKVTYDKFRKYIPAEKLKIVHYAVDMPKTGYIEKHCQCDSLKVVMIGRMASGKRQEDAVKAIGILKSKGINVSLELIGGADPAYLKAIIHKQDLHDVVTIRDFVEAPFSYVQKADVALVCSVMEAFGRVTIEAMKLGTPVIASDSGASPEIIKNGWNGILYECKNYEDLSDKIAQLYYNPSLRNEISRNAFDWAWENFNLEKHGNDVINVMNTIAV